MDGVILLCANKFIGRCGMTCVCTGAPAVDIRLGGDFTVYYVYSQICVRICAISSCCKVLLGHRNK